MNDNTSALLTDLYQLTMAQGYFSEGMKDHTAVFNLFFRKGPFGDNFAISAGLENALDFVENFKFTEEDIEYLAYLKGNDGKELFSKDFLDYLYLMENQISIKAIPEGELVLPHEPILQVKGPIIQCQLLETPLLNIINFQTLIATKAARLKAIVGDKPILEFGLRRAHGPDGGLSASRAAYIGGCSGTSNVLAGKKYDIPVKGTHAHSWIMSFSSEGRAFESYIDNLPNNAVLLVDTYNTITGVKNAIKWGKVLRYRGYKLAGIRLDSGDLVELSKQARNMLDQAEFPDTKIIASNDLDEEELKRIVNEKAPIDAFGVGTKLVTAYEQPALGGVYKLSAIAGPHEQWQYKMKLSDDEAKCSIPGIPGVLRYSAPTTIAAHDIIYDTILESPEGDDLLQDVFVDGQLNTKGKDIHNIRGRVLKILEGIRNPNTRSVKLTDKLDAFRNMKIYQNKVYIDQALVNMYNDLVKSN